MKKFILASLILFIAGVGCKRVNPLCGCSPMQPPELMLAIKNAAGNDLLDNKTVDAFSQDKIKLFKKDANGNETQIAFYIRPPFAYGNDNFSYYSLYSIGFPYSSSGQGTFYLKLGDAPAYELNAQLNSSKNRLEKLLIDSKEAEKDNGAIAKYTTIFYLTK